MKFVSLLSLIVSVEAWNWRAAANMLLANLFTRDTNLTGK